MSLLREIYLYTSSASILIPLITGIRNYKVLTKPFKLLLYFFLLTLFVEIQAEIFRQVGSGNNMPGLHVYTAIEFMAFSLLFYLQTSKRSLRTLIMINALIFLIIAITDALWINGLRAHNDLSRSYSAISMTVYALSYLYYLFTVDDTRYMQEYPMFWICIGMLFYFASDAIFFSIRTLLIKDYKQISQNYNLAHAALNIITYCLYAQSFKCFRIQTKA